ncbi:unnamed protein product [Effrenium voratum]|nr:unnamed protein product [Effrenium voratum]
MVAARSCRDGRCAVLPRWSLRGPAAMARCAVLPRWLTARSCRDGRCAVLPRCVFQTWKRPRRRDAVFRPARSSRERPYARLPPDFDIITGCVQPLALLASVVRAIAWVLAVLLHVVRLQGIEEFSDAQLNNSTLSSQDFPGDFSWTSLWQAHLFTAACVVCCLDAAVVSRGCCGSFQERWLSMNSLAGWAWACASE